MQNTGNQYRLQKISEIQQQVEAEKQKRTQLGEKMQERGESGRYNRLHFSLFDCGVKHLRHWSFSYNYCRASSHYN